MLAQQTFKFIDEFYKQTTDALEEYAGTKPCIATAIVTPKTQEDAAIIAKIYQYIYRGTYPYKEMEDPAYIYQTFSNSAYVWGLFKTVEKNAIVGCFTVVLDKEIRRGYFRGMMILPEFQRQVNSKQLCLSVIRHAFTKSKGQIDVWYSESRTAHPKAQYISTLFGAMPHALYMNKDRFFEKDETDVLMIAYTKAAFYCRSKQSPEILEEILPFYQHCQKTALNLQDPKIALPTQHSKATLEAGRKESNVKLEVAIDKYNYHTLTLTDSKTEEQLTALYTPLASNIEKIDYTTEDPFVLYRLLHMLLAYSKKQRVKYVELFVTPYQPQLQNLAMVLGFEPVGYAPAWSPHKWILEDRIVFAKYKENPQEILKLIPEAEHLLDLVETFEIKEKRDILLV